jgi:hypothetical protein
MRARAAALCSASPSTKAQPAAKAQALARLLLPQPATPMMTALGDSKTMM